MTNYEDVVIEEETVENENKGSNKVGFALGAAGTAAGLLVAAIIAKKKGKLHKPSRPKFMKKEKDPGVHFPEETEDYNNEG